MFPWKNKEKKNQIKRIEHVLFQVKYARRMKEDLLSTAQVERLRALQRDLRAHLKAGRLREGTALAETAEALARELHPAPRGAFALRENVEVFVVVFAVALGFRTYFFQPYQIPTGSMQPTLYGITAQVDHVPDWTDRVPVRWAKFLLTGARYRDIRAKADGLMPGERQWRRTDTFYHLTIGGRSHKIHKDMIFAVEPDPFRGIQAELQPGFPRPGTPLKKGDRIAAGLQKQGDHILVNRVVTNFRKPRRGDIVVFSTNDLPLVRSNSAYIKRLTGLPGETVSIRDGNLVVDGQTVTEPWMFRRQTENPHYSGYANPAREAYAQYATPALFPDGNSRLTLGEDEYLVMGDNTHSSLDGRFFGGVPARNFIGIGWLVPWPFFNRGIHNDRAGVVH